MKLALVSLLTMVAFNQAQARECTSQENLDKAIEAMNMELKSDLEAKASGIFAKLKREVNEREYTQIQKYGKPLETVAALKLEARLVPMLQEEALKLDPSVNCRRDTYLNRTDGAIDWICHGQTHVVTLLTNESNGYFNVKVEKRSPLMVDARLRFFHSVEISERYEKISIHNGLNTVLFPASQHGGGVMNENSVKLVKQERWDMSFEELVTKLNNSNKNCNQ